MWDVSREGETFYPAGKLLDLGSKVFKDFTEATAWKGILPALEMSQEVDTPHSSTSQTRPQGRSLLPAPTAAPLYPQLRTRLTCLGLPSPETEV